MTQIIALKDHPTDKDSRSNKVIKDNQTFLKTSIKKPSSIRCISYIN